MQAKYPGHCGLCDKPIQVGDEIERNNAARPHRLYVHAACNPTSGVVHRAGYRVTVTKGTEYIATGHSRQFVYKSKAESQAAHLRSFGCEAEVIAL